jgi:hypothetical protein
MRTASDRQDMNLPSIRRANLYTCLLAIGTALGLSGCATVLSENYQTVSVETLYRTGTVSGAHCKLQNNKGTYYVTTPGTVPIHRGYGDLIAICEKDGIPPGIASFPSSTRGIVAGNVVLGGLIGAGVDAATGAAYDYPVLLQIMMGETNIGPIASAAAGGPRLVAAGR